MRDSVWLIRMKAYHSIVSIWISNELAAAPVINYEYRGWKVYIEEWRVNCDNDGMQ